MKTICKNFKIKDRILNHAVIPAPMCGIMDAPFRDIISEFGTSALTSEMIASHATIVESRHKYFYNSIKRPKDLSVHYSVQIAGCDGKIMAHAAKMIEDFGADAVDINFGCPVKKIVNSMGGSALLKDPYTACKILEDIVKSVKIPVTLKMRIGWDFDTITAPEIAKKAEELGIQMIVIHCRTRSQLYTGQADWTFAKKLKDILTIPVIVNGDILNTEDVKNAIEKSNADGVMIGRGLYGKPWLIAKISDELEGKTYKEPNIKETARRHVDYIMNHYDNTNAVNFSKKHLLYYSKGMEGSAQWRGEVSKANSRQEIENILKDWQT